jgi:DNA repair photolyase
MSKQTEKQISQARFLPSHYAECIGKYELDLTAGCNVGCGYCALRESVYKKKSISAILAGDAGYIPSDLAARGIYLSPNSDPFSKPARNLAHELLAHFLPQKVPFLLTTKNRIPEKTLDLLGQYRKQVYVQVSIARVDDEISRFIEPGAVLAKSKLENLFELSHRGIPHAAILMPLFLGMDDTPEALRATVESCAQAGTKYLKAAYAVINPRDEGMVNSLTAHPDFAKSYAAMNEFLKIHIGSGLTAPWQQRVALYKRLVDLCTQNGMQFQGCPILDPAVADAAEIPCCKTYLNGNNVQAREIRFVAKLMQQNGSASNGFQE